MRSRSRLLSVALILCLAAAGATANVDRPALAASGSITNIVITDTRSPTFEGMSFGDVGPYEHMFGYVDGELDPEHPRNARIANLDLAPRNASGNVEYRADIQILKPVDLSRGNGALILDVPNRGNKRLTGRWVNGAPSLNDPNLAEHAGTGWLMREGYTVVWVAWEALVAPGNTRLTADFPVAMHGDGSPITALTSQEFIFNDLDSPATATLSYPAESRDRSQATLTVRQYTSDPRRPVDSWEYLDDRHIRIDRPGGYDAGAIYELVYRAKDPIVLGIGLASVSNTVSKLRHEDSPDNPLAGAIDRAFAVGFSQPGRVLRDIIGEGFNTDEDGRIVFDGAIPVIAGSRRSAINIPFGITGDYSRQHETHTAPGDQFPFTYEVLFDPISGRTDGIFARCRADATCPKTFHVDSHTEVFQARASLVVTTTTGAPLPLPENVRAYFLGGSQHGPATEATVPTQAQFPQNPLQYDMYFRALISALDQWVTDGTPPPDTRYPSLDEGTLVKPSAPEAQFPTIPGHSYTGLVNELRLLDHSVQPPEQGAAYPVFVVAKDDDGNNSGGVRHPFVEVPVATYTGWNLRGEGFAKGALAGLSGTYLPFPDTRAARMASGDERLSLEERYSDRMGSGSIEMTAAPPARSVGNVSSAGASSRKSSPGNGGPGSTPLNGSSKSTASTAVKRPEVTGVPLMTTQPSYAHPPGNAGSVSPTAGEPDASERNQTPLFSLVSGPSVGVARM